MARTKTNTQVNTKQAEHQDATEIHENTIFVFFGFFFCYFFLFMVTLLSSDDGTVVQPGYTALSELSDGQKLQRDRRLGCRELGGLLQLFQH